MGTFEPFGAGVGRGGGGRGDGGRGRGRLPFDLCLPSQQFEENRRQREAAFRIMFEDSAAPPSASAGEDDSAKVKDSLEQGGSAEGGSEKAMRNEDTTAFEMEILPKFNLLQVSDSSSGFDEKNRDQAAAQEMERGDGEGCGAGGNSQLDELVEDMMSKPAVMDRLFDVSPPGVLSISDCRLVSKYWHEKSLGRWRDSTWVHLSSWEGLQSFLEYVKDPENDYESNPCRYFHLVGGLPLETQLDRMEELWELCGEHITGLRLEGWKFSILRELRKLLYWRCPNLRTLVLGYDFFYSSGTHLGAREPAQYEVRPCLHPHLTSLTLDMNEKPLPISWVELLSNFPGLTAIKLVKVDSAETVEKMLNAINLIRQQDPNQLALKHLDLLGDFPNSQREVPYETRLLLLELQLPLETLAMDFGSHTKRENVKELLGSHAKTLRSLVAYRDPLSSGYFNFPFGVQLEKLEELCLPDNFTDSLEFLGGMPSLRKLHVGNGAQDRPLYKTTKIVANTSDAQLTGLQLRHLTELRLDYAIGAEDLRGLMKCFPNVRRLRMFLNNEQFKTVCEGWRKLQNLQVFGDELTDEGVIGRNLDLEEGEVEEVAKRPRPNITWLTNLTSFVMDNGLASPTHLTEISAFEAFLQMDSLLSLKLCAQISEVGIVALNAKIPNCEIVQLVWDLDEDRWVAKKKLIVDQRKIEKEIEEEKEYEYEMWSSDSD